MHRTVLPGQVQRTNDTGDLPSDEELGQRVGLGERIVRDIGLSAGLNRWHVAAWIREREREAIRAPEGDDLCVGPILA